MPQLGFREALSTPDEKLFVRSPVDAASVSTPRSEHHESDFANAVGFSRSTWTNIVFVTIACLGGLFSAFYFFNGAEVLRAAAAWPSEFLYPRPASTEKIDIGVQPNPSDALSRVASSNSTSASSLRTNDSQNASLENFPPSSPAPAPAPAAPTDGTTNPPSLPAPVVPLGPIIVPPVFPPPPPPSVLDDLNSILNGTVSGADALVQSLFQTVDQTVTSAVPRPVTRTASRTINSTRRKVATTRQKLPVRTTVNGAAGKSSSQTTQQVTTQIQTSRIQSQSMLGGAASGTSGISGLGSAGGVGGIGSIGGIGNVGGIGGVGGVSGIGPVGGLPGVGLGGQPPAVLSAVFPSVAIS